MKSKTVKNRIVLKSKIKFDLKIAKSFSKSEYYIAYGEEVINLPKKEQAKRSISTPRKERVTKLIESYKKLLKKKKDGYFYLLKGIHNKNKTAALSNQTPPTHANLIGLVSSVPMLITSYARIRKNKGATTLGAMLSFHDLKKCNVQQRRYISRTANAPDGLTYDIFKTTSKLLKKGEYPWGASKRIYIDKPGRPGELRPITIPPFMDRVVQSSILRVLESIYEPWFDKVNRSFGFRPHKGVWDAMVTLKRKENRGLSMAIEGDIKGAYDNVQREKLIEILSKKITDRKFLNLIRDRLEYTFFDMKLGKYVKEDKGIPQGGIDSPYLWNIYFHEFDLHIQEYLTNKLNGINEKLRTKPNGSKYSENTTILSPRQRVLKNKIASLENLKSRLQTITEKGFFNQLHKSTRNLINKFVESENLPFDPNNYTYQSDRFVRHKVKKLIQKAKFLQKQAGFSEDPNKKELRFAYCRYADDWIILGNFSKLLAEEIREYISTWLKENLYANLVIDKTNITDITTSNAHFLGFEIRCGFHKRIGKVNSLIRRSYIRRSSSGMILLAPDRQRLISRLHMKGYCNKNGKPKHMPWLSPLEPFVLIKRFNDVLRGLVSYYQFFVTKSSLTRWIYIITQCLLKTLANKFRTRVAKIYKKYHHRTESGKTISFKVRNIFTGRDGIEQVFYKEYILENYKSLMKDNTFLRKKYRELEHRFYTIEKKIDFPSYKAGYDSFPTAGDYNFLNRIVWVNLRTHSSFDLPCALCGSSENINMHHIKAIRKSPLSALPAHKPYLKMMALRNRKQIPVCRSCHMNVIHKGTYFGANLRSLSPKILPNQKGYDLRLINIENYIKPGQEYFSKTLEEKGWKKEVL